MKVQPAGLLRTTLPLAMASLEDLDSGRYHSVWLPDHMLSFWPDTIWTPEFTDLALTSHSPHRHLDAIPVAGALAVSTKRVPIATSVVDTVRRHPTLLAQGALTIDHLSGGRFILGLGAGETANTEPYGFDGSRPASRFIEALEVITLLWQGKGPVNYSGQFYRLQDARLDVELYDGKAPGLWVACSGPRLLQAAGRYADGWFAAGAATPEIYASMLSTLRASADRAGRDPDAIVPCNIMACLLADDEDELADILEAPLVKSLLLRTSAARMASMGFEHPMGAHWGGMQDINPTTLTRERIIDFLSKATAEMVRAAVPCGTPAEVARWIKGYCDAGLRVFRANDWSSIAGQKFVEPSLAKIRRVEDEVLRLEEAL